MESISVNCRECDLWCCEGFGRNGIVQNCLYEISEGCVLSKDKGIILKLTLDISAVACHLDSSGCVHRHSDVTTVTDCATISVRLSEIATQTVFPQFEKCSCSLLHTI